jgi:hypothetical protein
MVEEYYCSNGEQVRCLGSWRFGMFRSRLEMHKFLETLEWIGFIPQYRPV